MAVPTAVPTAVHTTISVNWLFLHEGHRLKPFSLDIPLVLFTKSAQSCQKLFARELKEYHDFKTKPRDIAFYMPKVPVSMVHGWEDAFANMDNLSEILPPIPFSDHLPQPLVRTHIHLVVAIDGEQIKGKADGPKSEVELLPEVKRFVQALKLKLGPDQSPSKLAKSHAYAKNQKQLHTAIYDGRYVPTASFTPLAPPIQIFHPTFENFLRRVSDPQLKVSPLDIANTHKLMVSASGLVPKEATRAQEIRDLLSQLLGGRVHVEVNQDMTSADGVFIAELTSSYITMHLVITEWKRELGEGGCDVVHQAGLSFRRRLLQPEVSGVRDRCCCPTFLIAGGGSWLTILGGVFTDKFIIQRLTDMMSIGYSSTHGDARTAHLARIFVALRETLPELRSFYLQSLHLDPIDVQNPNKTHPRLYPYPSFFKKDGQIFNFTYLQALEEDPGCVAFRARTAGAEAREIVVKFVSEYGEEVHKFLANEKLAPKLHYVGPLPDLLPLDSVRPKNNLVPIMKMVVMDYVRQGNEPEDARMQVQDALTLLHAEGYVLGDLRRPNVLFDETGKLKLIDFDWAGRYKGPIAKGASFARYPLALSRVINWPQGAGDLQLILPEHDIDMLNKLFPPRSK